MTSLICSGVTSFQPLLTLTTNGTRRDRRVLRKDVRRGRARGHTRGRDEAGRGRARERGQHAAPPWRRRGGRHIASGRSGGSAGVGREGADRPRRGGGDDRG